MRYLNYITFVMEIKEAKEIFKSIGRDKECNLKDKLQSIELFDDTEEYTNLIEGLRNRNVHFDEFKKKVYNKEELKSNNYYYFYGGELWGYPQPENSYMRNCYDIDVRCPICKNGAKQISPISLKSPPPKRINDLFLVNWIFEYIVSERLVDIFIEECITGVEFWPVINYKTGKEISGWKQLKITNELPAMSKNTKFPEVIEDEELLMEFNLEPLVKCECGKSGYNIPEELIYEKDLVNRFCDINKSCEWLGGGVTTYPVNIVSKNFYEILEKNKIKNINLIPIKFL